MAYIGKKSSFCLIRVIRMFTCFIDPLSQYSNVKREHDERYQKTEADANMLSPEWRYQKNYGEAGKPHQLTGMKITPPKTKSVAESNEKVYAKYDSAAFSHLREEVGSDRVVAYHSNETTYY